MNKITMNEADFRLLIKSVKSAIATNENRPILTWAKLEITKTHITAVALDGYRLAKFEMPHGQETEPFECYIRPLSLPNGLVAVDIIKEGLLVKVKLNCVRNTLIYEFIQPQDSFIDYSKIRPETDKELVVAVSHRYLMDALKPFANGNHAVVKLSFKRANNGINPTAPFILSNSERDSAKLETIVLPMRFV
jgi:DNA polymerase III sliding clamp (beta) subunit (PCNA family)